MAYTLSASFCTEYGAWKLCSRSIQALGPQQKTQVSVAVPRRRVCGCQTSNISATLEPTVIRRRKSGISCSRLSKGDVDDLSTSGSGRKFLPGAGGRSASSYSVSEDFGNPYFDERSGSSSSSRGSRGSRNDEDEDEDEDAYLSKDYLAREVEVGDVLEEGLPDDFDWSEARRTRDEAAEEEEHARLMGECPFTFTVREFVDAKQTVADLIRAGDGIEEKIEVLGEEGKLNEAVLAVIQRRLLSAQHDNERVVAEAMDLLFRRINAEIQSSNASPSMRLLNELMHMHDGSSSDTWRAEASEVMRQVFAREGSMPEYALGPIDVLSSYGTAELPDEDEDDMLLRTDFLQEVDELLAEVEPTLPASMADGLDEFNVAIRFQQEEKLRTLELVKEIRQLALTLTW